MMRLCTEIFLAVCRPSGADQPSVTVLDVYFVLPFYANGPSLARMTGRYSATVG
jgi:hypothetical protein